MFIVINDWYVSKKLERVEVQFSLPFLGQSSEVLADDRNLRFVEVYCSSISLLISLLYTHKY